MYANGTVINNCLSKETIKEYFPKPRASKTPDIKTPKDETIKLKDKIKNRKKGDKSCNDNNGEHTKKWTIRRYKYLF